MVHLLHENKKTQVYKITFNPNFTTVLASKGNEEEPKG